MTTFSIQRGVTAICTWDLDAGKASLHANVTSHEGRLVLSETDRCAFVLRSCDPSKEYRLSIGDIALAEILPNPDDAVGSRIAGELHWREYVYFESAKGLTKVVLEECVESLDGKDWETLLEAEIQVLPTKLGEERYQQMADDLGKISRSLLVDLYGKSTQSRDLRFAKDSQSQITREQELHAIEDALERLGELLAAVGKRPASKVISDSCRRAYWGGERISVQGTLWLSRQGGVHLAQRRPIQVHDVRPVETFDIAEHRIIKAFLEILARRASRCASVAEEHIRAIVAERSLRDVRFDDRPTIYEAVDLPRIRRLEQAARSAARCTLLARTMQNLYFLRNVPPVLESVGSSRFQQNSEYREILTLVRHFMLANAVWFEGDGSSAVTKLTSVLFEQWCYLRIVEAFRACGLELREWSEALREHVRSRFILDFDRGMTFEGSLSNAMRLRIRYQPWIFGQNAAVRAGEFLYRGPMGDVPWCPDVVIECLTEEAGQWSPAYVLVLDSKYTARIQNQHWTQTVKYLEIRSTHSKRQIAKQLWLMCPDDNPSICSEDPAVQFDEFGASCAPDESVRFKLLTCPLATANGTSDPFNLLARGTISYLRKNFAR